MPTASLEGSRHASSPAQKDMARAAMAAPTDAMVLRAPDLVRVYVDLQVASVIVVQVVALGSVVVKAAAAET